MSIRKTHSVEIEIRKCLYSLEKIIEDTTRRSPIQWSTEGKPMWSPVQWQMKETSQTGHNKHQYLLAEHPYQSILAYRQIRWHWQIVVLPIFICCVSSLLHWVPATQYTNIAIQPAFMQTKAIHHFLHDSGNARMVCCQMKVKENVGSIGGVQCVGERSATLRPWDISEVDADTDSVEKTTKAALLEAAKVRSHNLDARTATLMRTLVNEQSITWHASDDRPAGDQMHVSEGVRGHKWPRHVWHVWGEVWRRRRRKLK